MSGPTPAPSSQVLGRLRAVLDGLEPLTAARAVQKVLAQILADLDGDDRAQVIMGLAGESGEDKVASLVHL